MLALAGLLRRHTGTVAAHPDLAAGASRATPPTGEPRDVAPGPGVGAAVGQLDPCRHTVLDEAMTTSRAAGPGRGRGTRRARSLLAAARAGQPRAGRPTAPVGWGAAPAGHGRGRGAPADGAARRRGDRRPGPTDLGCGHRRRDGAARRRVGRACSPPTTTTWSRSPTSTTAVDPTRAAPRPPGPAAAARRPVRSAGAARRRRDPRDPGRGPVAALGDQPARPRRRRSLLAAVGLWAPARGADAGAPAPTGRARAWPCGCCRVWSARCPWRGPPGCSVATTSTTAGTAGLRVLIIVLPSAVLIRYVDADALGDHLAQQLRLPARPVVALAAALQRVHTFGELWTEIARARRVRGIGADGPVAAVGPRRAVGPDRGHPGPIAARRGDPRGGDGRPGLRHGLPAHVGGSRPLARADTAPGRCSACCPVGGRGPRLTIPSCAGGRSGARCGHEPSQ